MRAAVGLGRRLLLRPEFLPEVVGGHVVTGDRIGEFAGDSVELSGGQVSDLVGGERHRSRRLCGRRHRQPFRVTRVDRRRDAVVGGRIVRDGVVGSIGEGGAVVIQVIRVIPLGELGALVCHRVRGQRIVEGVSQVGSPQLARGDRGGQGRRNGCRVMQVVTDQPGEVQPDVSERILRRLAALQGRIEMPVEPVEGRHPRRVVEAAPRRQTSDAWPGAAALLLGYLPVIGGHDSRRPLSREQTLPIGREWDPGAQQATMDPPPTIR